MDVNRLIGQFQKLEQNEMVIRRTIGQGVNEARAALDEQYELLFGRAPLGQTPAETIAPAFEQGVPRPERANLGTPSG